MHSLLYFKIYFQMASDSDDLVAFCCTSHHLLSDEERCEGFEGNITTTDTPECEKNPNPPM